MATRSKGSGVVLVFPPTQGPLPYPHLGIPSLAGYLANRGYDVECLDLSTEHDMGELSNCCERIAGAGPGLIGISIVYPEQVSVAVALAGRIRAMNPAATLVAGGPMVTLGIRRYARNPEFHSFDALIIGDGEEPLFQLTSGLAAGSLDFSTISNCYGNVSGDFRDSGIRFEIKPEEYPTPKFTAGPHDILPIHIAKGCYWRRCAFCTYISLFGGYVRPSITRAVQQVQDLSREYGTRRFIFVDDALPGKVLLDLSREFLEKGIDVEWSCSSTFDRKLSNPEVGRALAEAGCRTIYFGFESANERILQLMGKSNRMEIVLAVLRNLAACGVGAHLNVIVDFPSEESREAEETLEFLRRNRALYSNFSLQKFSLEEGSEVYSNPGKFGITRILDSPDRNVSARVGLEFETKTGMTRRQRHFMAMKGQLIYRKSGVPRRQFLRRKLKCWKYYVEHRRELHPA